MEFKKILLLLLPILSIFLSTPIFAQTTQTQGGIYLGGHVELQKAGLFDILLCKLGLSHCIVKYNLEVTSVTKYKDGVKWNTKLVSKEYYKIGTESEIFIHHYGDNMVIDMTSSVLNWYSSTNSWLYVPLDNYKMYDLDSNWIKFEFVVVNRESNTQTFTAVDLGIENSAGRSAGVYIDIPDFTLGPNEGALIGVQISIKSLGDTFELLTNGYSTQTSPDQFKFGITDFSIHGSNMVYLCDASNPNNGYCSIDSGIKIVWNNDISDYTFAPSLSSSSSYVVETFVPIAIYPSYTEIFIIAPSDQPPGNDYVAMDYGYSSMYEYVKCPPHSHSDGTVYTSGTPYCQCDDGYINTDWGNDPTKTPALYYGSRPDSNGCETQATCSVDVSISPSSRSTTPNTQVTYTVTIQNNGNVECTYSLSTSCGSASCSLSQSTVTVDAGSSTQVTLYAQASSPGSYTLSITASSTSPVTGYSDTASATLNVQSYSCSVTASLSPSSKTVNPGQSAQYTLSITNNGNTQCTYSISTNCPSGVSCSLSRTSVTLNAGESTSVTLTASSNNPGTYTIQATVQSTSPVTGYSDTASATLKVQQQTCDITLSSTTTQKTTYVGQSVVYDIQATNNGNTQCTYSLTTNCPSGVSCSLSQSSITLNSGQSTTIQLTATPNSAGTYTLSVTASSTSPVTGYSDTIQLTLIAQATAVTPKLNVSPTSLTLNVSETGIVNVEVTNNGNVAGYINLTVDCPIDVSCTLGQESFYLNPGETGQTTLSITPQSAGDYTITVYAQSQDSSDSKIIYLTAIQPQQGNQTGGGGGAGGGAGGGGVTTGPRISVTVQPTILQLSEGQNGVIAIVIVNTGDKADTLTITVDSPLKYDLEKSTVVVYPGTTETVKLTIYGEKAGQYTVKINIKDSVDQTYTTTVSITGRTLTSFPIQYILIALVVIGLIALLILR